MNKSKTRKTHIKNEMDKNQTKINSSLTRDFACNSAQFLLMWPIKGGQLKLQENL